MKQFQKNLLYLYFFSINFELWDPFDIGIDFLITKITAVLYLLSTITNVNFFYSIANIKKYIYPIFGFFFLLTLMSFKYKSELNSEYFNVPFFFNLLILLAAINHSKRDSQILLKGLLSFAFGTIVLTIMYLLKIETNYAPSNRLTIFGINENELGLFLSIGMLILNSIIIENQLNLNNRRYLYYLLLPFMFLFMIETGSRVAFISFIFGVIIFVLLYKKKNLIKSIKAYFFLILLSISIWVVFLKDSLIVERLFYSAKQGDLSGREIRWISSIEVFLINPFFGVGETGFKILIEDILGFYSSPHNVIIEILCYTGILGLLIFIIFLTRIIKRGIYLYKDNNEVLPLLLFIPIFGMIISGQIIGNKIVWVLFTYVIGSHSSKQIIKKLQ